MIHHVSIAAQDPHHVADVLAELMGGRAYPFPGGVKESFMAVAGDEHGSLIEVYPESVVLVPGTDDDQQAKAAKTPAPAHVPFHLLLSVPIDRASVERIGAREGWRTRYFGRGAPGQPPVFHVIEFWIENRVLIEVATPDIVSEYTSALRPERLEAVFPGTRNAA